MIHSEILLDQPKQSKPTVLIMLCITNLLFNVCVSIVVPFYSEQAYEIGLSFSLIGIVIACGPLGSMVGGCIIGRFMHIRKWILILSMMLQSISLCVFGILEYIAIENTSYLIYSIISRLIQGCSRSIFMTIIFSYIPLLWPLSIRNRIAQVESMTAIGISIGPLIGQIIYQLLGYTYIYIITSLVLIMCIIPMIITLQQVPQPKNPQIAQQYKISNKSLLISTFILVMSVYIAVTYTGPYFVHHLLTLGYSTDIAVLLYTIPSIAYCIGMFAVAKFNIQLQITMSIGLLLCIIASTLLMNHQICIIITAQILMGLGQACALIPCIPRLITINQMSGQSRQSDLASKLFVTALSIGNFISNVMSGRLYDYYQDHDAFNKTQYWLLILLSATLIQYQIFGGIYSTAKSR